MPIQNQKFLEKDRTHTDPSVLEKRRAVTRAKLPRLSSELEGEKWIEHIDFEVFKRIFRRLAVRCNLDPESLNFAPLGEIFVLKNSGSLACFNQHANMIGLNLGEVECLELSERAKQLLVLHLLTHETIHAIGCIELTAYDEKEKKYEEGRIGFNTAGDYGAPLFMGFDEGLTELMTFRLVDEYLEETGFMKTAEAEELLKRTPLNPTQKWLDQILHFLFTGKAGFLLRKGQIPVTYVEEQEVVKKLLKVLAKETGVSEEEIFNAFMREKLEGETDLLKRWKELFIDLMGRERGIELFTFLATTHPWIEESKKRTKELLDKTLNG